MSFLTNTLTERLLFTIVVIGLLAGLYGVIKVVDISIRLSNNFAQQIQDSGSELNIQSTAEGRNIMASDLERRSLLKERGQMIIIIGVGVILLGVGWFGYDLRNNYRPKEAEAV
jgi:hypothetical protein